MKIHGTCLQGKRPSNQDYWGRFSDDQVAGIVVGDGNSGEGGGEMAKGSVEATISNLSVKFCQGVAEEDIKSEEYLKQLGLEAIKMAKEKVTQLKENNADWINAGTTLTLILIAGEYIAGFWVGDSPCYLFSNGDLTLLTDPPHTLAQLLIKEHSAPADIVKTQPGLNSIITRCLGKDEDEPDVKIIKSVSPALILVGSDGVFGAIEKENIKQIIDSKLSHPDGLKEITETIVQEALKTSTDNCTLVIGQILPEKSIKISSKRVTRLLWEGGEK